MRAAPLALCLLAAARPAPAETPQDALRDVQEEITAAEAQAAAELTTAIATFRRFLDEHPDASEATAVRFRLASLLFDQQAARPPPRDYAETATLLDQVLAAVAAGRAGSFTQAPEAWYLLGVARSERDPAAAAAAWEQVIALAPDSPLAASASFALGQQALDAQDPHTAAARFDAARGDDPAVPRWAQATYLAGWAHYQADAYVTATERFCALLPRDEPAAAALRGETVAFLALCLVGAAEGGGTVAERWAAVAALLPDARREEVRARLAELLDQLGRFDDAEAVRAGGKERRRRRR